MSSVYELNYHVLKYVSNPSPASYQKFYGFYHYQGTPDYTQYSPALLVLKSVGGKRLLERIAPAKEFGTGWRFCAEDNENGQCVKWVPVKDYAMPN